MWKSAGLMLTSKTISVVSSSPTMASVFVSLGKILNLSLLDIPDLVLTTTGIKKLLTDLRVISCKYFT